MVFRHNLGSLFTCLLFIQEHIPRPPLLTLLSYLISYLRLNTIQVHHNMFSIDHMTAHEYMFLSDRSKINWSCLYVTSVMGGPTVAFGQAFAFTAK